MQFDYSVGANQAQKLDVRGSFFKMVTGTGKVRVTTDKGESIDLLPGQGVWGVDFNWLSVKDRTGAANAGTILAGSFDYRDDRISGTVDVVDGGYNRTVAGQAFSGALFQSGVASQYSHGMLFNPANSNKRVIVSSYDLATNSAGTALIGTYNTSFGGGLSGASKMAGGQGSLALLQTLAQAAQVAPTVNEKILYLSANVQYIVALKEPIVLMPGFGLLIVINSAQAMPLTANFEYTETAL